MSPVVTPDQEEVLLPNLPIVDAHHHLWDDGRPRYLIDDLLSDATSGHNICASVYIECQSNYWTNSEECMKSVGEVEYAARVAAQLDVSQPRLCQGIVGYIDLRCGDDVGRILDAMELVGEGRFRGIRQVAAHDRDVKQYAPDGLLLDPRFRQGFRELQQRGYTFDAWLYHTQLPDLISLLNEYPESRLVINHAGGRIGIGRFLESTRETEADWKKRLWELARFPNVYVKLGGLGMPMCGHGFDSFAKPVSSLLLAQVWRPYMDFCIDVFGSERCVFESNFPVDGVSSSYRNVWNAFKRIASGGSEDEMTALFSGNAATFYSLSKVRQLPG
ncbi:amidohydrolase family protein [Paraburkholderia fynbosensis]|uniref:Amidohydrolase-related domain-containing protein n=1 Tax=Paraburkholderia fynbosensis TaxID=1200993 RepID=A0A6J5H1W4_9BURK|nr:amidohydrolase family protein [Paraburkholderia fynbosensis]CAB3809739.1 hypothetical protein LMG27177_06895 [Paraburkholderia fynbosensis]